VVEHLEVEVWAHNLQRIDLRLKTRVLIKRHGLQLPLLGSPEVSCMMALWRFGW
jgi:hypothetical protein